MAPRTSLSSAVPFALVATLVVAGLVVDAAVGGAVSEGPGVVEEPLLAGSATCAALQRGGEAEVTATTISAPLEDAEDPVLTLQVDSDGEIDPLLAPAADGRVAATPIEAADSPASITARWDEAPLLLARRWVAPSNDRVPGAVEGPCPAEPATEWYVPGVATAGGAAAVLHLANPTAGPASLAVTFTTPDGAIAPTRLANLAVPAHGQVAVDLNEFVPEEPDLGVVVTTRAGRVVAEVSQTLEAAVGGVDGRALVVAESSLGEVWTIPWVQAGNEQSAWVWVSNPGDEATDVRLVLHTEDGPVVPPDSGVTLAPGTTQRIDLRGALAEVGSAAVTVRSAPGVPIVASGAVLRLVEDDPVRGGVAVVEGQVAGGGIRAALSAGGAAGSQHVLALVNPGDDDAVVDVAVRGAGAAEQSVETGVRVPAGSSIRLDLAEQLPEEGAFAVTVEVTDGVIAAAVVRRTGEGPLDLVAMAARPFPATVRIAPPTVVLDRSLLHPLVDLTPAAGTGQGAGDDEAPTEDTGPATEGGGDGTATP